MAFGTLHLIPNTLGNIDELSQQDSPLQNIIPEHVQTCAANLDYFIAENAKTARAFLKLLSKTHPLIKPIQEIIIKELNINTKDDALPDLLAPILQGQHAGLISEAGVPAVADPGANLVRLAHQHNITVRPLVGPSSILLAVMASGLNGQSFAFNGYLPTDSILRLKKIKVLEERSRQEKQTQLFIETPYRNSTLFEALLQTCAPSTLICIATNLSLSNEIIQTKTQAAWKQCLAKGQQPDFHKKPSVFLFLAQ